MASSASPEVQPHVHVNNICIYIPQTVIPSLEENVCPPLLDYVASILLLRQPCIKIKKGRMLQHLYTP